MYAGTADPELCFADAPTIGAFDVEPVTLTGVEIVQLNYEIAGQDIEAMLPPALHPTIPMIAQWMSWSVPDSPWGEFNACLLRLTCRSGARPRTLLVSAVVNNAQAASALAEGWGFKTRVGAVNVERGYDQARISVIEDDVPTFVATAADPDPLTPSDLQFFASMHSAHTPNGLRLVQVDSGVDVTRAERYTPLIELFQADAWGDDRIVPAYPVIAFGAQADIALPALRFVCRADVIAFEGTERVDTAAG